MTTIMRINLDMNDPINPLSKVRKVEIKFTGWYKGDDAWNQNILVPKLEALLKQHNYELREYRASKYWDINNDEILEDDMREYIAAKHGHSNSHCSSCPDPIRWKEADKLARRIRAETGGMQHSRDAKVKTVYIMETQEERALRLKVDKGEIEIDQVELVKN